MCIIIPNPSTIIVIVSTPVFQTVIFQELYTKQMVKLNRESKVIIINAHIGSTSVIAKDPPSTDTTQCENWM